MQTYVKHVDIEGVAVISTTFDIPIAEKTSWLDGWFAGSLETKLCPNNVLLTKRMASQNILKNIAKLCFTPLAGKHI